MRENVFEIRKAIFHTKSTNNDFIDSLTHASTHGFFFLISI